ncbi:uncharacterized protein xmas [Diabrotica undecimpunctata]|uniref:uncharacterized protein xmas n=1 Tax=Diabrotica undecimpunctata TaxID=50387 RepID=UPI003B63B725
MDLNSYKIICQDYPPEFILDKNVAKEYFKQFGKLKRITFKPKARCCTVDYVNEEGYLKALNNAGDYRGTTFSVFKLEDTLPKKKETSKRTVPIWVDTGEIEAELAAMSGELPKLHRSLEGPTRPPKNVSPRVTKLKPTWKSEPKARGKKTVKANKSMSAALSAEEIELVKLVVSQGCTVDDKYRILEARDKLMKLKLKRNPTEQSSATVGTCPDMCPEKERLFREIKHQVAWYEQDENERTMKHNKAVKQYSRSSADQEAPLAHELRPVDVLQMTMGYLLHNIIDLCDTDEIHIGDWFHFLWDRTRSIRKDITQQELCSQGAVELVEQCARFHIHCSARLVAEDPSVFDQKINTENLTKCLQTLKYMYHDLSLKGESCKNEAEFRAYVILLNLNDGNFMWEVQQLRREIQQSKEVQFAVQVHSAIDKNNYVKFFKLLYSTTYLNACIFMRYFNQIRLTALKTLHKCYLPRTTKTSYPLTELTKVLAFDDIDSTRDFLEYYGLFITEDTKHVILDKNGFIMPELPYILDRSNIVEEKRQYSVGKTICGKDLPPKTYESHKLHNSFDQKGYLIDKDILEHFDLETVKLKLLQQLEENVESSKTKNSSFAQKSSDTFVFAEREEKADKSFSFKRKDEEVKSKNLFPVATKEQTIDNPFLAKKGDNVGSPFLFNKMEEKVTNPFAFSQNESTSKQGSIFDTTPPSPKNIFGSSVSFQSTFGTNSVTNMSSTNQTNFSFITQPVPQETKSKLGGFKFDLVLPSKQNEADLVPEPDPTTVLEIQEQRKRDEEELFKKQEEERLRYIEEQKKLEMQRLAEQKRLDLQREQKQLELKRLHEQRRLELMRIEEEKRREELEEALREEKRLREIKKQRQEEELRRRLEEIRKEEEQLKEMEIKSDVKNLINSLVDKVDHLIRQQRLIAIKENMERRLVLKIFCEWKTNASKNRRKRKAIDCSPLWINTKTLEQSAHELSVSSQDLNLTLMKRYKYGKPLDIEHLLMEDFKCVNLFELTYAVLKNRIFELTVNKPKNIFWKVVVSLPDANELKVGLNRLEEAMESAFLWSKSENRYLHLEHCKPNNLESVTYCVEKQQGSMIHQFDANGIIFLAKDYNSSLQQRILASLKGFGVHNTVPIVIILQEYNSNEKKLENLMEENIITNCIVLVENAFTPKLINAVEEGLLFLAKNVESWPPLELDSLKSFISKYLCTELWKRANSFAKWNSSYKKCLQNPNVVLNLYNEGLRRLKSIILDKSNSEYAVFPEEFKKYLKSKIPDYLPCSFHYFPRNWKSSCYFEKLERILDDLSLPAWKYDWPPLNEQELELSVMNYCSKLTGQPRNLFYKTMSLFLQYIDPNINFKDIQYVLWTDIIGPLALQKLASINHSLPKQFAGSIFKEYFVIYNKNILSEYDYCDWFYIYHPVIKKFIEEDLIKRAAKEIKKNPTLSEHLEISEQAINTIWESCLLPKPEASRMAKELSDLNKSLDNLAATMAVQKRISSRLEQSLSNAIAER